MKIAVLILVLLGILAAGSAVVLVQGARAPKASAGSEVPMVDVVVAANDCRATTVLTTELLVTEQVLKTGLPAGYYLATAAIVGRILKVDVVKGQVITEAFLVAPGTAAEFASKIPQGMLAFTISVPARSVSGGLLYPACLVDVIATFRLRLSPGQGEAFSTTLLQAIQVLAVDDTSVVSAEKTDPTDKKAIRTTPQSGGSLRVTLMVDAKQAEGLHLAMEHGNISLAMRNPLDREMHTFEGTYLAEGRLHGSALNPADLVRKIAMTTNPGEEPNKVAPEPNQPVVAQAAAPSPEPARRNRSWQVTVIQGQQTENTQIDLEKLDRGSDIQGGP